MRSMTVGKPETRTRTLGSQFRLSSSAAASASDIPSNSPRNRSASAICVG